MAKVLNTMNTIVTNSFVASQKEVEKVSKKSEVSKADLCRAFFKANPGLARKDYIAEFMNLGMTQAGAATYWYNIRKAYKNQAALATIHTLEEMMEVREAIEAFESLEAESTMSV